MSQRVDQRTPTSPELQTYSLCLELTEFTFSVCKARDKNGDNHKHIPKRFGSIARQIESLVVQMGALILEANEVYVRDNLNEEDRLKNYKKRIMLQDRAISLSYQLEHYMRVMHRTIEFADSTISHWCETMWTTRRTMVAWKNKDTAMLRDLINHKGADCLT